jgi:hypothetical protein
MNSNPHVSTVKNREENVKDIHTRQVPSNDRNHSRLQDSIQHMQPTILLHQHCPV